MILESIAPGSVDLVCLPEMIFSGRCVLRLCDAIETSHDIEHCCIHLHQATFLIALKLSYRILKTLKMGRPRDFVSH